MSEQRKLEIEKLKKQREYLTNPQNINFMKKYEENQERESGKEEGKKLGLHNGNIKGFETPYNQYQKNGYINAILLGILTFFFESLFLIISYFIFK